MRENQHFAFSEVMVNEVPPVTDISNERRVKPNKRFIYIFSERCGVIENLKKTLEFLE